MSRFVIAAFKPKTGMQQQLSAMVEKHWRVLEAQNLVTSRPRSAMQAADFLSCTVRRMRSVAKRNAPTTSTTPAHD